MHCALQNNKEVLLANEFLPQKNACRSAKRFTEKRKIPKCLGARTVDILKILHIVHLNYAILQCNKRPKKTKNISINFSLVSKCYLLKRSDGRKTTCVLSRLTKDVLLVKRINKQIKY